MTAEDNSQSLKEKIEILNKEKCAILEAIEFAGNVGNFQISLNKIDHPDIIIKKISSRIKTLINFKGFSFYLVSEKDSDFYQSLTEPEVYSDELDNEVNYLIDDKTFSWALSSNKPLIVSSRKKTEKLLLHGMSTSSRTRGLFIGILGSSREEITDLNLFLFSVTIIMCSNALESFELYRQIREKNDALNNKILQLKASQKKLRASEEKYRGLFEQANHSIILYDMKTRKALEFNDHAYESLGYSREIFRKLRIEDYEVDKSITEIKNRIKHTCKNGSFSFETRHKSKNGEIRNVLVNSKCINLQDMKYLLTFSTDITDKKQFEAERRLLERQLLHSQKMDSIGTLAGGIAHDFNNILGIIMGYAELVQLDVPEDNNIAHSNLKLLIRAVERARNLIKQILTFSRYGDETPQPIEVNGIISETIFMLRSTLPSTINIKQSIIKEPLYIMGNSILIHQILLNLCTNAAQAMRGEPGDLTIQLDKIDSLPGTSYMQLKVNDTGGGIPPEIQERVFDPYFTTKKKGEGTGLGLAVVHGIVKGHGGDIRIKSTMGKGTLVVVTIPLIEAQVFPEIILDNSIKGGSETILLVDDEIDITEAYQRILESLNYTVIATTSSHEALQIFQKKTTQVDLVISDMTMPHMTGIQLAGELLSLRPDIPIILCTGFSEIIDPEKAKALGIKEFLMKPLNKNLLANAIRKVLDEKK